MIPEIGFMIGLFILARLVPARWKLLSVGIGATAFVVAAVVVVDLGIRGVSDQTLASLTVPSPESTPTEPTDREPVKESATDAGSAFSVTTADGGSITTNLKYGLALAKGSSLNREWIAVHDSSFPAELEGTPGVGTIYRDKRYRGEYRYTADFTLRTRAAVRAFEVRFLTFDVWGNHVRTLSYEEVTDIPADSSRDFSGKWSLYSEHDAERHYASLAYVARVRLADGSVVRANNDPILEQARKFFAKFSAEDLEPKPVREKPGENGE